MAPMADFAMKGVYCRFILVANIMTRSVMREVSFSELTPGKRESLFNKVGEFISDSECILKIVNKGRERGVFYRNSSEWGLKFN